MSLAAMAVNPVAQIAEQSNNRSLSSLGVARMVFEHLWKEARGEHSNMRHMQSCSWSLPAKGPKLSRKGMQASNV